MANLSDIFPGGSGGSGSSWNTTHKTANYTAISYDEIQADTSGGSWTLTLPATPSDGDRVRVLDINGVFSSNALTVTAANNIQGSAEDMLLDVTNAWTEFVYSTTETDWRMVSPVVGEASGSATSADEGLVRLNGILQKEDTVGGAASSTGNLSVLNVPQGTYRVTVGGRYFFQSSDANCYITPQLNNADISLGGGAWFVGPRSSAGIAGELGYIGGLAGVLIVDFPNATNSFDLNYTISGTSGVSIPYYTLEKLENTDEITTEWN